MLTVSGHILGNSTSELAEKARKRISEAIDVGKFRAGRIIKRILDTTIQDKIVRAQAVKFTTEANKLQVWTPNTETKEYDVDLVHPHALRQLASRADIPLSFVQNLQARGDWGVELLAKNLSELYAHQENKFLVRRVGKEVRGFLSDGYRRTDAGSIIHSFVSACDAVGALPYEGYATDTKFALQAILPFTYEPVPNEVLAYGVSLEDSAFGNGPTQVSIFVLRGICLNGMIATKALRRVHLGRQLSEDMIFEQDTYEADSKALSLKVRDVVRGYLDAPAVSAMIAGIRKAHEEKIESKEVSELLKKSLTKGEAEVITAKFNEADVEMLPAGNSKWRLANAISWVAKESEDAEKKIELQKLAGSFLKLTAEG